MRYKTIKPKFKVGELVTIDSESPIFEIDKVNVFRKKEEVTITYHLKGQEETDLWEEEELERLELNGDSIFKTLNEIGVKYAVGMNYIYMKRVNDFSAKEYFIFSPIENCDLLKDLGFRFQTNSVGKKTGINHKSVITRTLKKEDETYFHNNMDLFNVVHRDNDGIIYELKDKPYKA